MTGQCKIDNTDIYTAYGVIIAENGYNELLQFPAAIEPDKNDWAEFDGVEADLTTVILQPREITVPFAVVNGSNWRGFYTMLTASGYRNIQIPALAKSWTVRVVEMPTFEDYAAGDLFSIKFVEDLPLRAAIYPVANATIGIASVLSLDGKTLDKYGIIVENGLNDLQRPAKMKEALSRKNALISGQVYDTQFVRHADKEVTFKCCLNAAQIADFWNLYNAFFGDLTKSGARMLSLYGKNYEAYYRKSDNFDMLAHTCEIVCRFDVTLCITKEL